MSKQFTNIKVLKNAYLNDVVFENIGFAGKTCSLLTDGNTSIVSSTGTVSIMSNSNVKLDSINGSVLLQSGIENISDGSIILKHSKGKPVIEIVYTHDNNESKIGFFGVEPKPQPKNVDVDIKSIHEALVSLGLIS